MADPKAVLGVAPCDQIGCTEKMTVHEVKRGGSTHRGQLYTRCPACGCNQTTGAIRQKWLLENTAPRAEFADLFEFKKAAESDVETVSEDSAAKSTQAQEPEQPHCSGVSSKNSEPGAGGLIIGVLGLTMVAGLAALGLKK